MARPPKLAILLLMLLAPPAAATPTTEANYTVLDGLANVTAASLTAWLAQWVPFPLVSVTLTNLSATRVTAQTCGLGTYSPADAQTCSVCPPGTYSPSLAATSIATCVACPAGTYSGRAGATALGDCAACPANTYFEGTGATSVTNCSACAGNSSSTQPFLRANCVCNPGYSGPGGEHQWQAVIAPPTLTVFFSGGPCSPCTPGSWCMAGVSNPCPLHSLSPPLSSSLSQCSCIPGYFGDPSDIVVLCQVTSFFLDSSTRPFSSFF